MKKLFSLIAAIIILSCSTNNDSNGNSSNTVVPTAPSNLIGAAAISTTEINLSWTDNSTNETGFKIQRRTGTENYAIVGTVNEDVLTFFDSGLLPNTTYIYRVYAYNAAGNSPTYSNEVTITTLALPTLTTTSVTNITITTATTGGTITTDGGAEITARGVCWNTTPSPTIELTTKTFDGIGTGAFTTNITGVAANTTYYVRAYATNSVGTVYGNEISFTTLQINVAGPNVTDIDGNTYQSVTNCGLTFTKQNLNVSKYSDGTPIPQVVSYTQWPYLTTGAWCYYSSYTANGPVYGKLYNWYAVAGIYDAASLANPVLRKKLAPNGWHMPSDAEWKVLINCLDPNTYGGNNISSIAGGKMKAIGTIQASTGLWESPNTDATNASGFTGLPGGYRYSDGSYNGIGSNGKWWSSSETNTSNSYICFLSYNTDNAASTTFNNSKKEGLSVRCVKD